MPQNRIKTLHHNGNPLKQKRTCLHQSPAAQLAQELESIPVDWAVRLHRNRDEFTVWWQSSILIICVIINFTTLKHKATDKKKSVLLRSGTQLSLDCRSAQLASSFRRSMLKTELFDIAYTEYSDPPIRWRLIGDVDGGVSSNFGKGERQRISPVVIYCKCT